MRALLSPLLAAPRRTRLSGRAGLRLSPWLGLLLATGLLLNPAIAQGEKAPAAKDDFSPLVKLAPFVVNGQSLAISIYARSNSDRRYGEQFAEGVARVVYEAVTESTGKGLVMIGAKGDRIRSSCSGNSSRWRRMENWTPRSPRAGRSCPR